MIGPLLIAISWLLLRLEGSGINALGFNKPRQRSVELLAGLAIAAFFAALQYLLIGQFSGFRWVLNQELSANLILESLRWNINSVLFEELVFRGYLLYKAIQLLGPGKGCALSATAFGVYHWFSFGVFGSPVPMLYVFALTGVFGFMFALAFARSQSLFLPVGLHLGWNLVTISVFSNGPLGPQLLVPSLPDPAKLNGLEQGLVNVLMPLALVAVVCWALAGGIRRYRRSPRQGNPSGKGARTTV